MKIRSFVDIGKIKKNDIVDAVLNKSLNHAVAFDNDDMSWSFFLGNLK